MAENTNTERDYPPLPKPAYPSQWIGGGHGGEGSFTKDGYSVAQLRAYVDADRKARASLSLPAAGQEPVALEPERSAWINPCDKSQDQYLPHIGEPVLFKHEGRVYTGKHTGGSFKSDFPLGKHFDTWNCVWAYPSALDSAAPQPAVPVVGQEPVAWSYVPSKVWGDRVFTDDPVRVADAKTAGCNVTPLYAAPQPAAPVTEQEPVAWQERQQTSTGWTPWYDAELPTSMDKGPGLSEVLGGIEYQWRPLYAAPQPAMPYSIDADPHGIRATVASAITGALAFGAQGVNPPPEGHWLAPFWNAARADAAPQPAVAAGWLSVDAQPIHLAWRGALKACGVNEAERDAISEVVLSMLAESSALPPAPSTEGERNDRMAAT